MSKFLQKLIENTNSGDLDFVWKYNDGSKSYTFIIPKHYLSGMNFSLEKDFGLLIFPNGFAIEYSKENINQLKDSINISLERTVETSIKMYVGETSSDISTSNPDSPQSTDSKKPGNKNNINDKKIIKKNT